MRFSIQSKLWRSTLLNFPSGGSLMQLKQFNAKQKQERYYTQSVKNYNLQYTEVWIQSAKNRQHIPIQHATLQSLQSQISLLRFQMKVSQKGEDLFHLFIQYADKLPVEAEHFPEFEFMDQSIRKSFNQLKKKTNKKQKQLSAFDEFWQELTSEDKVKVYCNWVLQLRKAIELEKIPNLRIEQESMTIQDQIYIKKTNIFQTWEKKIAKLTPARLYIGIGSKNKEYELRDFQIRKSRAKDHFAWVLQAVTSSAKTLHCKAETQSMFDEWFYALTVNISNQRIQYFLNCIRKQKANPRAIKTILEKAASKNQSKQQKGEKQKTLTEIMIDKQMKSIDNDNFTQIDENGDDDEFQSIGDEEESDFNENQKQKQTEKKEDLSKKQEEVTESNPNIFRKLVPDYQSLLNFADTPFNSALIYNDAEYRIYELPQKVEGEEIVLKMFTVFPYPKALVFQAISTETMGWNDEVDMFTVKTKISSENTALIYEKNKAYGLLYRERDFLYLRHCFSVMNLKQKNTFMIDKSIDSIHHPPFMSVVRAERKLIWGLIQKQNKKQCILIVEGWIKGGGYMNQIQNKDMTVKYMKKINTMRGFLKQLSFSSPHSNNIFKEDWSVDFNKEQSSYLQGQKFQQALSEEKNSKTDSLNITNKISEKQASLNVELAQFMKRTLQEETMKNNSNKEEEKQEVSLNMLSEERFELENYKPPAFDDKKFVIIPQKHLKKVHVLIPKEKPSKPNLYPHIRGHHLWKGEWEVQATGGLGYVDQEKMKEQKKVLTYIIKRIGKNIFTGKGILNISLPVDIFCVESNIERLAMSFGFMPYYFQKAAGVKQAHEQMKYIVCGAMSGSLIYMTMQKPFNPILGETYQCWIDGCPVYFQQISHHPPIAAFLLKGRGFTLSGCVEAKMDLSINSGTGNNDGIFKVQFDNGNTFYYTTPAGCLSGLTYGERRLNLVGKCYYWTESGLFLEATYNPAAKTKGFFGGGAKGEGDEKLPDYFEGFIKQYSIQDLKAVAFKQSQSGLIPVIPKAAPSVEPIQTHSKIWGRWSKYVKCNEQTVFDVDSVRYYAVSEDRCPLPSHSNYREDIVYRRLRNFVVSQEFKQVLEIRQREDRKLRAKFNKKASH